MVHASKVLPVVLLLALAGCADIRVTKVDLERNSYEITPLIPWLSFPSDRPGNYDSNDEELKQQITQASAGLCGMRGVENLDVERPAYIRVPMAPRGYLHCR